MAGALTVSGTQTGIPSGQRAYSLTISPMSNYESTVAVVLASGANTITVPTAASGGGLPAGFFLIPPPGNTQTLTLKGVTGDTGIPISPTQPTVISFAAAPPTSFVITAGGTVTGETAIVYF